jgi:hypothetical protein
VRGEPLDVYACSCLTCQKKSGGAFTYAAVFAKEAATVAGGHNGWRHTGESGRWIENHFCPNCGISVFFHYERRPDMLGVPVGCFSDPDFAAPNRTYWSSRKHRWLTFPEGVELLDTQPE